MATITNLSVAGDDVSSPLAAYSLYMAEMKLPMAIHSGTKTMRAAKHDFLPQEEGESVISYESRLKRSALSNYYRRTVEKLVGQAFEEGIEADGIPAAIEELIPDIDQEGNSLSLFMSRVLYRAIHKGLCHVMVEYPNVPGAKTVEDHKKAGARPYWVIIEPENVIGWRHTVVNGVKKLTQLRIKETVMVDDGKYGEKAEHRIRLYEPGKWEVYVQGIGGWAIKNDENGQPMSGVTTLDYIPLVTYMIGEKMSEMTAMSCLADLAELNCIHWQSSSDQRNVLHYARLITYFGKLLQVDESGKVIFGANKMIHSNSPEGDLKIVEHSGAGIEAGRNDLKDLELTMAMFGLTMMLPKVSGVTATENSIEKGESDSALTTWIKSMESTLETLLEYTCNWIKAPKAGTLIPFSDFGSGLSNADNTTLIEGYKAGLLPKELVIIELKARGVISQEIDMIDVEKMFEEDARKSVNMQQMGLGQSGLGQKGTQPAAGQAPPAKQ